MMWRQSTCSPNPKLACTSHLKCEYCDDDDDDDDDGFYCFTDSMHIYSYKTLLKKTNWWGVPPCFPPSLKSPSWSLFLRFVACSSSCSQTNDDAPLGCTFLCRFSMEDLLGWDPSKNGFMASWVWLLKYGSTWIDHQNWYLKNRF